MIKASLKRNVGIASGAITFYIALHFLLPFDVAYSIVASLSIVFALGVLFVWRKAIYYSLTAEKLEDGDHLIIGIGFNMVSMALLTSWFSLALLGIFEEGGRRFVHGMMATPVSFPHLVFFLELRVIGTLFHLTAPSVRPSGFKVSSVWRDLLWLILVALGLASLFVLGASHHDYYF